jgi:hypothetical protein
MQKENDLHGLERVDLPVVEMVEILALEEEMTREEFEFVVIKVAHTIRRAMDQDDFPGLNMSAFRRNRDLNDDVIRKIQAHMILEFCRNMDAYKAKVKFLEAERMRLRCKILDLNHKNYSLEVA